MSLNWPDIFVFLSTAEDNSALSSEEREAVQIARKRLEAAYREILSDPHATRGPLSKTLLMELDKVRGDEREFLYGQLMAQQVYEQLYIEKRKMNLALATRGVLNLLDQADIPTKQTPSERTLKDIFKRSIDMEPSEFLTHTFKPLEALSTYWYHDRKSGKPNPAEFIERLKIVESRGRNKKGL